MDDDRARHERRTETRIGYVLVQTAEHQHQAHIGAAPSMTDVATLPARPSLQSSSPSIPSLLWLLLSWLFLLISLSPLLVRVSADDSCTSCTEPLKVCGTIFSPPGSGNLKYPAWKNLNCPPINCDGGRGGPVSRFTAVSQAIDRTTTTGWADAAKTVKCTDAIYSLFCQYAEQAGRGTTATACPGIKLFCKKDCDLVAKCLIDTSIIDCNDPLVVNDANCYTLIPPTTDTGSTTGASGALSSSSSGAQMQQLVYAYAENIMYKRGGTTTAATDDVSMTFYGPFEGGVARYTAIPYAPPVGALTRWKSPVGMTYTDFVAPASGFLASKSPRSDLLSVGVTGAALDELLAARKSVAWTATANKCVQQNPAYNASSPTSASPYIGSEDCLYMNVFSPYQNFTSSDWICGNKTVGCRPDPTKVITVDINGTSTIVSQPRPLLPVMVFIHGGNYANGSADDVNPPLLVRQAAADPLNKPIIIVTFNYRLGVFGFLAHAALSNEAPIQQTSGLYAIEDQRRVFEWVKLNIIRFGGHPYKITVVGEGSGATLACMHVFNLRSANLFDQVVLQSGTCNNVYRYLKPDGENAGDIFARALYELNPQSYAECILPTKVTQATCLRKAGTSDLFKTYLAIGADRFLDPTAPFMGPLIDGWIYPEYVNNIIDVGQWNPMPMMMGTATMEWATLIGPNNHIDTAKFGEADGIARLNATTAYIMAKHLVNTMVDPTLQPKFADLTKKDRAKPADTVGTLTIDADPTPLFTGSYATYWDPTGAGNLGDTPGQIVNQGRPFDVDFLRAPSTVEVVQRDRGYDLYADPAVENYYLDAISSIYTSAHIYCPMTRLGSSIGYKNSYVYVKKVTNTDGTITGVNNGYDALFRSIYIYRFEFQSDDDLNRRFGAATAGSILPFLFGDPSKLYNLTDVAQGVQYSSNQIQPLVEFATIADRNASTTVQRAWLNFMYYGSPADPDTTISPLRFRNPILWSDFGDDDGRTIYQFVRTTSGGGITEFATVTGATIKVGDSSDMECRIWKAVDHVHGADYLTKPTAVSSGETSQQFFHCEPLNQTSFCAGFLNYQDVNLRTPFACQADVEHFLGQMPAIVAALKRLKDAPNLKLSWPRQGASDYLATEDVVTPCIDQLAFTVCRLLYRPCKYDLKVSNHTTDPNIKYDVQWKNTIEGSIQPPCGSVCHDFRYKCPLAVTSQVIAPIFDLYLPTPLSFDVLFKDCTSADAWNGVVAGSNCTFVSSNLAPMPDPVEPASCECYNSTLPGVAELKLQDTPKPDVHPIAPICQDYNGTVCKGIINYQVYVPAGQSLNQLEDSAQFLIPLQILATVKTGCRESFARHTCSSIFMPCDKTAQYRATTDKTYGFGFQSTAYDYAVPYPQLPCQHICSQADAECGALFSAAPQSRALVNCGTIGRFVPTWTACPDPEGKGSRAQIGSEWIVPPDYPEGQYQMVKYAKAAVSLVPTVNSKIVSLTTVCNGFQGLNLFAANVTFTTLVTINCPFPMVIPDSPDAASYAGGSCALPCPSILWTNEQWGIGDAFFNICVVASFLFSVWLALSYTIFPVNSARAYLRMLFLSIFFLSITYLLQILYSGFKPHTFGCKDNSQISRQSDGALCTLAGASFMYFINASVQWWMVISLDMYNSLVRKKKYTLKQLTWQRRIYHAIAWGMPLIFVIIAAGQQSLGRTSTVPWCFMTDDTTVATEWGIMWIPLGARLFLGMVFMGLVARTMYQQGSMIERSGTGDRWGWFKMQAWIIALVVFFCFVFMWLIVYRAYMLLKDAEFQSSTDEWIQCLIYGRGDCGDKPKVYPTSLIWYGMIGCVGAQGIACGIFFGFERRNFVLWSGFLQGKGRNYFTRPDVDNHSQAEKGGGFWTKRETKKDTGGGKKKAKVAIAKSSSSSAISHNSVAIDFQKSPKNKTNGAGGGKGTRVQDNSTKGHIQYR